TGSNPGYRECAKIPGRVTGPDRARKMLLLSRSNDPVPTETIDQGGLLEGLVSHPGQGSVRWAQLDDRARAGRRDRADLEAGRLGQPAQPVEGALPAADVAEHAQVPFGVGYDVLGIADVVHDQHLPRVRGRVGAPLQDANGILVIPVVEDAREYVAARSGWKRIEEAADPGAGPAAQAG